MNQITEKRMLALLFQFAITHATLRGRSKELPAPGHTEDQAFDRGYLCACLVLKMCGYSALAEDMREQLRRSKR